jgi:hypothetical protein
MTDTDTPAPTRQFISDQRGRGQWRTICENDGFATGWSRSKRHVAASFQAHVEAQHSTDGVATAHDIKVRLEWRR